LEKDEKVKKDLEKKAKDEKVELIKKLEEVNSVLTGKIEKMETDFKEMKKKMEDAIPVRKGLGADNDEREEGQKTKLKKIRESEEYKNARGEKKLSTFLDHAIIEGGE